MLTLIPIEATTVPVVSLDGNVKILREAGRVGESATVNLFGTAS